ncbi:MAG: DUF5721 family protein [Butyrivibrio sp.]|nr:DUF5721 family protein [Butyrivibrio sp.]
MLALKILHTKEFMAKLLAGDVFDNFLLEEAIIETYNTFSIDGHIHKEFYQNDIESPNATENSYLFSSWSDMKGICFNLIKGKNTPLGFRFVLHLKPENALTAIEPDNNNSTPSNDYCLNIKFRDGAVTVTSAVSIKIFTLDKTADSLWDSYIKKFFSENNIDFTEEY